MKRLLPILMGLTLISGIQAQDPSATPKFTGGHITGDAVTGGPVGTGPESGNNDFNLGTTGGSTADVPTPTPSPKPSATPAKPAS